MAAGVQTLQLLTNEPEPEPEPELPAGGPKCTYMYHLFESTAQTDELERALTTAKERAQELTDQAVFDDAADTARAETEAWEQVRRLSKGTRDGKRGKENANPCAAKRERG